MIRTSPVVQRWIARPLLLCGALGLSACAPARPVTYVTHTEVVRPAPVYAPVELDLARQELDNARLAFDAREYERARRLADQAIVDARLAEVRATTETSRQAARDLAVSIDNLRAETVRVYPTATVYFPPSAPIELRLAMEELDSARLALDARDYDRARRLADQALADAQLAEVRSESENARRIARDVRLSSEALRDESVRISVVYLPSYSPVELQMATEELDRARLALDTRDYVRARRLADQALADARLAEARATTESSRQAARDLALSIESLRTEAVRTAALY